MDKKKTIKAVRPNVGIEADVRVKLRALIEEMHNSVLYWLEASYRENEPAMATDAPADELATTMRRLTTQWRKNFNEAAPRLAKYFATQMHKRSDAALRNALKEGGYSVKFKMTPQMQDVLKSTIHQQVSLIKSIPQKYLSEVEGLVMRSVQTGRKLDELTDEIELFYGVTRKRAALIARDQNNKATSAMTRARKLDLGLDDSIWMHSHAGHAPRPTHVKMNGRKFKLSKGMWDPAVQRYIQPGEEINCRCTSRPIIPGLGS